MNDYWQLFTQQLLLNAIPILIPIAVAWLVKIVFGVWSDFKYDQPDLAHEIERAAGFAVKAAEQVGLSEQFKKLGGDKLDFAVEVAERWLAAKGIKNFDIDLLVAAIEKSVIENYPHKVG